MVDLYILPNCPVGVVIGCNIFTLQEMATIATETEELLEHYDPLTLFGYNVKDRAKALLLVSPRSEGEGEGEVSFLMRPVLRFREGKF